jgi:hypothetical protein
LKINYFSLDIPRYLEYLYQMYRLVVVTLNLTQFAQIISSAIKYSFKVVQ